MEEDSDEDCIGLEDHTHITIDNNLMEEDENDYETIIQNENDQARLIKEIKFNESQLITQWFINSTTIGQRKDIQFTQPILPQCLFWRHVQSIIDDPYLSDEDCYTLIARQLYTNIRHSCTILMGYPSRKLIVQSSWGRYSCFGGGNHKASMAMRIHSVRRECWDESNYDWGQPHPEILWRSNPLYVETNENLERETEGFGFNDSLCMIQVILIDDNAIKMIEFDDEYLPNDYYYGVLKIGDTTLFSREIAKLALQRSWEHKYDSVTEKQMMWYGMQQGCTTVCEPGTTDLCGRKRVSGCNGSYQYLFHITQSLDDPFFDKIDMPKFRDSDRATINLLKEELIKMSKMEIKDMTTSNDRPSVWPKQMYLFDEEETYAKQLLRMTIQLTNLKFGNISQIPWNLIPDPVLYQTFKGYDGVIERYCYQTTKNNNWWKLKVEEIDAYIKSRRR